MTRTPNRTFIVTNDDADQMRRVVVPNAGPGFVAVPVRLEIDVNGLPWSAHCTLEYDATAFRFEVTEITIAKRPGGESLSRGQRAYALQGIAEQVLRSEAKTVRLSGGAAPTEVDFELTGKKVSAAFAEQLARGRSKQQQSVKQNYARVVQEYKRMKASGETIDGDLYSAIAAKLNMGRTTVYAALKAAGQIEGRK